MQYDDLKAEIKEVLQDDVDIDIFISYMQHGIDLFLTKKNGCIEINYKLMKKLTKIFDTKDVVFVEFSEDDDCSARFVIKQTNISIRPSK